MEAELNKPNLSKNQARKEYASRNRLKLAEQRRLQHSHQSLSDEQRETRATRHRISAAKYREANRETLRLKEQKRRKEISNARAPLHVRRRRRAMCEEHDRDLNLAFAENRQVEYHMKWTRRPTKAFLASMRQLDEERRLEKGKGKL
ncbi:hypothetical protein K435DRAFT_865713 [Dendrothele bispora CBS 962.96]|uniref:Uncharacterized protein n=1 Tax=Dendrothele bispora (strain CBS 962.96) TaxID=1314807 RepID=A0A4S8LIQ9_DENBC|nr:hypothetical protein K435DRAFT_865713 [Dendrothele bispora CBS 962.96]